MRRRLKRCAHVEARYSERLILLSAAEQLSVTVLHELYISNTYTTVKMTQRQMETYK